MPHAAVARRPRRSATDLHGLALPPCRGPTVLQASQGNGARIFRTSTSSLASFPDHHTIGEDRVGRWKSGLRALVSDEFFHPETKEIATRRIADSPTCCNAPSTSPVWPPIDLIDNHASVAAASASTSTPIKVPLGPKTKRRQTTPSAIAATVLCQCGCPAPLDSPSARAGGTRDMNAGSIALEATCAAISAIVTSRGSAISCSALQRNRNDSTSAQAPKLPIRLSRIISNFCSRVLPPRLSAASASPSS